VGSVYRYFPDKETIVEALALRYWSDFEDLVAAAAQADERALLEDVGAVVLDALAAGFRARPGFLALWYGGLRTERVRDATRPTRSAIAASIEKILASHWPRTSATDRRIAARMVVLAGDSLLREAFRQDRQGDARLLEESKKMLGAYLQARLG
jgi:AcrR family transcriptional regulator